MPEPRLVEIKLGLRTWRIAVQDSADLDLGPEEADLFVVRSEALAPERLNSLLRERGWSAGTLPAGEARRLDPALDGACLILAPTGALRRFLAHFAEPEPEAAPKASPEVQQGPAGRYPDLPDPADVPRFAEEGSLDPFAQDGRVQWAAWSSMADRMIRVVDRVHGHGLAVSLPPVPQSIPGRIDPRLKPWRTLVRLNHRAASPRDRR